ncbi:hypothetical protein [Mycobacterium tilburgii]|uniref:hypothetical protein n=1 Tax=Mycobacterium tilburgii TaxID=44467 RepID=UPI00118396F9|nr:hypothetical protein [Mycobacterium tilburgii]
MAELLPFRWRYVWTLFVVAIAPIALWLQLLTAFAATAVITLAEIYAVHLYGARIRLGLLKWGRVATVTGIESLPEHSISILDYRSRGSGPSPGCAGAAPTPRRRCRSHSTATAALW